MLCMKTSIPVRNCRDGWRRPYVTRPLVYVGVFRAIPVASKRAPQYVKRFLGLIWGCLETVTANVDPGGVP